MELDDIWIHDCILERVEEITATQELLFHVRYPFNWDGGDFRPRIIAFSDVTGYTICDGLFQGSPALLHWSQVPAEGGRKQLTIGTNNGTRTFSYRTVELRLPAGEPGPLDGNHA